jgi:hypothetical protein
VQYIDKEILWQRNNDADHMSEVINSLDGEGTTYRTSELKSKDNFPLEC